MKFPFEVFEGSLFLRSMWESLLQGTEMPKIASDSVPAVSATCLWTCGSMSSLWSSCTVELSGMHASGGQPSVGKADSVVSAIPLAFYL